LNVLSGNYKIKKYINEQKIISQNEEIEE